MGVLDIFMESLIVDNGYDKCVDVLHANRAHRSAERRADATAGVSDNSAKACPSG